MNQQTKPQRLGPEGRFDITDRGPFLPVFLILLAIYAVTAAWSLPYHGDAFTNAVTGWYVGNEFTVVADEHEPLATPAQHGNFSWFVPSPRGPVSQYPPGASLLAGALYLVTPGDTAPLTMAGSNRPDLAPIEVPVPPIWPATLSAVLATAAACAVLSVVFQRLGGTAKQALAAGLVAGLATTAWSVASNMSWTHGPGMLAIALGLLGASTERWFLGGLALGFGILVRPHIAVIAAILGVWAAIARRSWTPLIKTAAGSGLGLLALLGYNYWVWQAVTISGGYGGGFRDQFINSSLSWFASNVFGAFFDPLRGLLVWAPFLVILVGAGVMARRGVPDWASAAAIGGVVYLLIQLRANRFSGGDGHFAYRYPLATLTAAAPWLFVGYHKWVAKRPFTQRILLITVLVAFVGQVYGAVIT